MPEHTAENDAYIVNSVNGEQMLATPAVYDGTPGWMSIEDGPPVFWGRRYVACAHRVIPPGQT